MTSRIEVDPKLLRSLLVDQGLSNREAARRLEIGEYVVRARALEAGITRAEKPASALTRKKQRQKAARAAREASGEVDPLPVSRPRVTRQDRARGPEPSRGTDGRFGMAPAPTGGHAQREAGCSAGVFW